MCPYRSVLYRVHKLFVILICNHQEKHNKDELTRGAGGRIKEVEEFFVDEFAVMGEDLTAGRLRAQEEIHLKAIAALPDEVSTMINSVKQTTPTHLVVPCIFSHPS